MTYKLTLEDHRNIVHFFFRKRVIFPPYQKAYEHAKRIYVKGAMLAKIARLVKEVRELRKENARLKLNLYNACESCEHGVLYGESCFECDVERVFGEPD